MQFVAQDRLHNLRGLGQSENTGFPCSKIIKNISRALNEVVGPSKGGTLGNCPYWKPMKLVLMPRTERTSVFICFFVIIFFKQGSFVVCFCF